MKVLLVDDEPINRMVVKAMLERAGVVEVVPVASGVEALKVFDNSFDLLVTDLTMPVMDGITLARKLTQRRSNLPVLFISGYLADFNGVCQRSASLMKPFHWRDLKQAISSLFSE